MRPGCTDCMDPQAVADAYAVGRALGLSQPVARGEIGEVRRLETDRGTYAVKQAFGHLTDLEVSDLEAAGAFHRACWKAGIPTPEPVPTVHDGVIAQIGNAQVLVY